MNRRTKQIGAILALVAMILFAFPIGCWLYFRSANAALVRRTRAVVEQNPQLQPAWDQAMQDQVLTSAEAAGIAKQAKPAVP